MADFNVCGQKLIITIGELCPSVEKYLGEGL